MNVFCPSCKSSENICIGEIPQINLFQGIELENILPQSKLYKCKDCSLNFRYPIFSSSQYDKLYKKASLENWNYDFENRKDWQLATKWIHKISSGGSLLDVGCWDGSFLKNIRANWRRFGVEINSQAASKAEDEGIEIIAENFSDISQLATKFTVVTAFDMIEHVEDPLSFVTILYQVTEDNGYIIISSGNTEALTCQIMGSKYSYCANPEHISFINITWCFYAAERLNLNIEYIKKFSHSKINNPVQFFIGSMANIIYLIVPSLIGILRKIKNWYLHKENICAVSKSPPPWRASNDHIIIFFKKRRQCKKNVF